MGWLDKTFKNIVKSPLGKAAIAGGLAMTPWGQAAGTGIMGLLGKAGGTKAAGTLASLWAKPLISKPLTNAAMSYGLAKLMRSRNPEKAAMWGALTTLPFLGSEAYGMANAKGMPKDTSMWDILLGKARSPMSELTAADKWRLAREGGFGGSDVSSNAFQTALKKGWEADPSQIMDLNYFMKSPTELAAMNAKDATGMAAFLPKSKFDILNTFVPMLAGTYGGRETDAQAWDRKRKQRIQQLAWMYGVDPSMITGEMTNPWYDNTPPGLDWKYANQGGIMELPTGGAISGPGTGTSDSINAKVSDGEFVMTAKAVENFGGGDRQAGAQRMYSLMNQLDPQSQTAAEGMV